MDNDRIIKEYNKGLSQRKVAEIFNITKFDVYKILVENNVHIRNKSEAQRGRIMSDSHKNKISQARKGKKLSKKHIESLCGKTPHNKGNGDKKHKCLVCGCEFISKPYRKKKYCSKECRDKSKGKIHHNYKGLESRGNQTKRMWKDYRDFKKKVHSRDKRCLSCGSTNSLQVHHIMPWSSFEKKRFDVLNGITLCKDCHRYLHSFCGMRKIDFNKQNDWIKNNSVAISTW